MYTATKLGDSVNKELQRRIVTVQFDDGAGHVFVKDFSFALTTELEAIKRTVKSYLDEINLVQPEIDDLVPDPDPTPTAPTAAELNKAAWEIEFAKLEKVQRLINCGALTGAEAPIVTLRNKVKTDFKPEYLN